jgi:hypothetical protein
MMDSYAFELVYGTPLPEDSWDLFLHRVRERLIKIATDGFEIKTIVIHPEDGGSRFVEVSVKHADSLVTSIVWEQAVKIIPKEVHHPPQ